MIEVKSLKPFTDKETGIFRKSGDAFSVSEERAKELADKGCVSLCESAPTKAKTTRKKKG